jgi:hypothetical protein
MSRRPDEPAGPFLQQRDAPTPSPTTPAAPPDLAPPTPRTRRDEVRRLRTLLRVVSFGFVAIALGGGLLSNARSGSDSSRAHEVTPPVPAPAITQSQGRYALHVVDVAGRAVTLRDSSGRTFHWTVSDPDVRALLTKERGTDVLAYWRRSSDGTVDVVGVDGAQGRIVPEG